MDTTIEKLRTIIATQLNWGSSADWQGGDFRRLSEQIFNKTGVSLSESTLRRLWGKANYPHDPSEATLDTLARFADYPHWRAFKQGNEIRQPIMAKKRWPRTLALITFALAALTVRFLGYRRIPVTDHFAYSFSSRPVTTGIPNSVVFTYRVAPDQRDPVFIQQSWDSSTRVAVSAADSIYSSIYYRPGFYQARLIVGSHVVREHPLLIATTGWVGMINQSPVPKYLDMPEFLSASGLSVSGGHATNDRVNAKEQVATVEFYNVGNFEPVPADSVHFTAWLKCDEPSGVGICGRARIVLITNGVPLSIPICARGCVATLYIFDGQKRLTGQSTDLSGFGADVSQWVKVDCANRNGRLEFKVNDRLAYAGASPPKGLNILGIGFHFEGGGSVKSIDLQKNDTTVFKAF